jgi:hypothetical protein
MTRNWWLDGFGQVTVQPTPRGVAVDPGRDVFCTVTGFGLLVVQPAPGRSVNVVSTLTGLTGPLLCSVAPPTTPKGTPAVTEGGRLTVAAVTFTSVVALTAVVPVLLVIELLPPFESLTWS